MDDGTIPTSDTVVGKVKLGILIEALEGAMPVHMFTTDGQREIDNNNRIENEIRPIALGVKNYLFAGSDESAQRIAMIYSLLASCKKNEIDPMKWLINVLEDFRIEQ